VQAIADTRWFVFGERTIVAAKEANEDIRTTEIAAERRITFCVVYFVIKIRYDMIQDFRIRMIFVLDYFLKELK
jgi:hypothetical protein